MKLEKVLDKLNSFEKNSFLKIIDNIISDRPKNHQQIEKLLSDSSKELKDADHLAITNVLDMVKEEFSSIVLEEFERPTSQVDIIIDILIKDGNCILSREWFSHLYDKEIKLLGKRIKEFKTVIQNGSDHVDETRIRDYNVYKSCLEVAYNNDLDNNQECKISSDEHSILAMLAKKLGLSQDEKKLINYSIIAIKKLDIDEIINSMRNVGILFYSKKHHTIFVADEIVAILRTIRGKEVADKYFRRVLKLLKDSYINQIGRKYGVDRQLERNEKIEQIIGSGVSFTDVISNDMFKEGISLTERKSEITTLADKGLDISPSLKGATLEAKVSNLIDYFNDLEKDEKVAISLNGYDKLLSDLKANQPNSVSFIMQKFEFQEETIIDSNHLLDYNIKPRDILEILNEDILCEFAKDKDIKTRGNIVLNILAGYKDVENLYLENYEMIGARDLKGLKENGIEIKEAELGVKFEELTKTIFSDLGFNVDESLRKQISNAKNKIDIVLNLGNKNIIVIECKSHKESGYNKFSSVSRQIKAYIDTAKVNDYNVVKSLLIAPEFSDEFINECELEYELNLSLITASSLGKIMNGFKESRLKQFPYKLLLRDVLIKEERIIKAISK